MRFDQLEYLVDIESSRSITITAQRFFVTQQAVSNNIKQLEEEVGATLLVRNPHGVMLTSQGSLLADFAKRVLRDYQETRANFETETTEKIKCFVRVGSASLLNSILMPKIINLLDRGQSEFIVNVCEEVPATLLHKISGDDYDVGIITMNTTVLERMRQDEKMKNLHFHVLRQDKLVVCVNAQGIYADYECFTQQQIQSFWKAVCGIYPIEEYERDAIEKSVICTNDVLLCRKLLLRKDLFVIMPELIYSKFFKGKKFVAKPIDLPEKIVETHCLVHKKRSEKEIEEFIKIAESCMRQL